LASGLLRVLGLWEKGGGELKGKTGRRSRIINSVKRGGTEGGRGTFHPITQENKRKPTPIIEKRRRTPPEEKKGQGHLINPTRWGFPKKKDGTARDKPSFNSGKETRNSIKKKKKKKKKGI